ncbi:hypothetical protein ACM26V_04880 [Salipaludibacillus sp. HK11]|uniref:hypothetical protein n=1 Tax=Salipaludibacillus sp. HK11 TaxID=3394320 RepID=UPI0039FD4C0A
MEIKKAIEIISLLADGIDPQTGEVFPQESTYQNPDTVRSLFLAVEGLKLIDIRDKRQKNFLKMQEKDGMNKRKNYLLMPLITAKPLKNWRRYTKEQTLQSKLD